MSENNIQVRNQVDEDQIEKETDYETAPVIDNTGSAKVRDFDAASDDHPLVEAVGEKALKTDIQGGGEFVSEEIYENDEKWVREWLQNAETAIYRRAKMKVELSDEYPDGWLTQTIQINPETGETVEEPDETDDEVVGIEIPRPNSEVLDAAKSLGYDPTIVWDIYRDERKIVTEDNGIGMTPQEFWDNFKTPFSSGSGIHGNTGGMHGIGSNSVEKVHGAEGAALVTTLTPRPGNHRGFNAYSYRGGATAVDGNVPDNFYGTQFEIPVQDGFNLGSVQDWVEKYADQLSVPILYREHDAGSTPIEEEYEATTFLDDFDDPPIKIERPGEFSLVSGPNVKPSTSYHKPDNPDTYMVSMKINRNTRAKISTLWDVVIQIHDEQSRIVAGPNRGFYAKNGKVYQTGQNVHQIGEVHEDDIILPEPTGDRDRLKKTDSAKEFFYYIENVVQQEEWKQVSDLTQAMADEDHASDAIYGEKGDWNLFHKILLSHGSKRLKENKTRFSDFVDKIDAFPDYDDETKQQIFQLFDTVERCSHHRRSTQKKNRSEKMLGKILATTSTENVYMAASTGGKFSQRYQVVTNTHDSYQVVVIEKARYYDKYQQRFGFKKLKEVPLTDTDEQDHDYDVPDSIHESNIKTTTTTDQTSDSTLDRTLKIRTDDSDSSIDMRPSVGEVQDILEGDNTFNGKEKLIVFPRTADKNISDHYNMAKYAAIVSVTKKEYDQLAHYDDVVSLTQFKTWSQNGVIATMDGAMTPKELVEDDRMGVIFFRPKGNRDIPKLGNDNHEKLRELYLKDIRDQVSWTKELDAYDGSYHGDDESDVDDADKYDTLFGVADSKVFKRIQFALNLLDIHPADLSVVRLTHSRPQYCPIRMLKLNKSTSKYRLKVDTPNWDNDSDIYHQFPRNRDKVKAQLFLGLHDMGVDPSEHDSEELRELIANAEN